MNPSSEGMELFGPRGLRTSFILFLSFLVPVSPLLADIQHQAASRDSVHATTLSAAADPSKYHVSSYSITLDLFGREYLADFPAERFLPVARSEACDDGRSDAQWETDGTLWFFMGLILSLWGPLLAYLINPSVPEANLKGKNADYALSYSKCYQEVAKSIHVKWAWYGLGTLALLAGISVIVYLLAYRGVSH